MQIVRLNAVQTLNVPSGSFFGQSAHARLSRERCQESQDDTELVDDGNDDA